MRERIDPNIVIDALGGTAKAARFFDVRMPTVSKMRKVGLPRMWIMYLRAVRPDIYVAAGGTLPVATTTTAQADEEKA